MVVTRIRRWFVVRPAHALKACRKLRGWRRLRHSWRGVAEQGLDSELSGRAAGFSGTARLHTADMVVTGPC